MDPIFKFPASPGTPLFPVSPERANRQQFPHSPSLPSISQNHSDPFSSHSRQNSDVQGKVAQFNNLTKEAAQRRKDNEAALKRAVLGREEAESETRRLKEENKVLRRDVEEGRGRERRVGERLESVMEDLQRSKETHAHSQSIYEKEVRRARKEAFKSSSALVKMQEELKSARNRYTLMKVEVDEQRSKVDSKEQEAFTAQYLLVGLQEELDTLRQQTKIVEEERDTLKMNLQKEEVARIASKGAIALPPSREGEEFASPRKKRSRTDRESLKENVDPQAPEFEDELLSLKEELTLEKRMRLKAIDQVHFMKMECQFQCCSCRIAERQGEDYVHDDSLATEMAKIAATIVREQEKPVDELQADAPTARSPTPTRQPLERQPSNQLINFSPTTGTFYRTPSPTKPTNSDDFRHQSESSPRRQTPPPPEETPSFTFPLTPRPLPIPPTHAPRTISYTTTHTTSIPVLDRSPSPAQAPRTVSHTQTLTTTIPLKLDAFDPSPLPSPFPPPASSMTREEALEQIRLRRGRARSFAATIGTPRKAVMGLNTPKRQISAPAGDPTGRDL